MQITITLDGLFLRRAALAALAFGGLFVLSSAQASNVATLNSFTAGTTISAAAVNQNFEDLRVAVNDNDTRLAAVEALLAGVSRASGPVDTIVFTGVNVQIKNAGAGTATEDGSGNLIVGHNENTRAAARTGSHNVVVGDEHEWTSHAGVIAGSGHTVDGTYGVAVGGSGNTVTGTSSVQLGGRGNTVEDLGSGTENADHTTSVGGLNEAYGEDDATAVGTGATVADIGLNATTTYIGDGSTTVDIGFESNNVSVGHMASVVRLAIDATQCFIKRGRFGGRYAGGYDLDSDGTSEGFELRIDVQNGFVTTVRSVNADYMIGTVDPTTGAFSGNFFDVDGGVTHMVPLTGTFNDTPGVGFTLTGTHPSTGETVTITLGYSFD